MDITRWSTLKPLIVFFAAKDGEALYIQEKSKQTGAECGSDHELLIENSDLNWRKKGIPLDRSSMT